MRTAPTTEDGRVPKYLAPDTGPARNALRTLRNRGYEAVLASETQAEELAVAAIQEDSTGVLLPDSYTDKDLTAFIQTIETYDAEDIHVLQRNDSGGDAVLPNYTRIPTKWADVHGVGETTEELLEENGLVPWNVDQEELETALEQEYDTNTAKSLYGKIRKQNPYLFST